VFLAVRLDTQGASAVPLNAIRWLATHLCFLVEQFFLAKKARTRPGRENEQRRNTSNAGHGSGRALHAFGVGRIASLLTLLRIHFLVFD
jgi:hypothetical protein